MKTEGRRPRGVRLAWHEEEGQEEGASKTRHRRRGSRRCCRAQESSEASRRGQHVRQDAQGVVPLSQGPVKHTLEECDILRRYFNKAGPSAEGGKDQGNNKKGGDKEEEFPEVHNCFMIYGGQVANASSRHCKQERREVCSVKVATPVYLDWSDKPITFDQGDHPDCVPSPGRYPLVLDLVINNARLTKILMNGGSSLNIIYIETLGLLGIDLSMIRAGAAPFHGIVPGKRVLALGQLDLPVCFGTPSNFRKETLTFEVVGF
jgi:hypothetical protein